MVFDKVRELLSEQLEIPADEINLETDIIEDLGADSLDIVELVMSLEEEYGIIITDESAVDKHTVGQLVEFIENLI